MAHEDAKRRQKERERRTPPPTPAPPNPPSLWERFKKWLLTFWRKM